MVLGESISRKTLLHLMRCQETWFGNHCPMRRKTSWKHGRKSVKWRKSRTGCGWSLARGSISGIGNHLTNWPTRMGLDGDVISNDVTNPKKRDWYTLWLFNVVMENGPFIDDFWWFTYWKRWFSMATLNNQRVYIILYIYTYRHIFMCNGDHSPRTNSIIAKICGEKKLWEGGDKNRKLLLGEVFKPRPYL
jgi:hypothetical protein